MAVGKKDECVIDAQLRPPDRRSCTELVPPDGQRCAPRTATAVTSDRTPQVGGCVRPGGPEVLEIRELPVPAVREGWSLVQVKAAGLNRSELRTRQGHSPA
jgi:hypothetical protein